MIDAYCREYENEARNDAFVVRTFFRVDYARADQPPPHCGQWVIYVKRTVGGVLNMVTLPMGVHLHWPAKAILDAVTGAPGVSEYSIASTVHVQALQRFVEQSNCKAHAYGLVCECWTCPSSSRCAGDRLVPTLREYWVDIMRDGWAKAIRSIGPVDLREFMPTTAYPGLLAFHPDRLGVCGPDAPRFMIWESHDHCPEWASLTNKWF